MIDSIDTEGCGDGLDGGVENDAVDDRNDGVMEGMGVDGGDGGDGGYHSE